MADDTTHVALVGDENESPRLERLLERLKELGTEGNLNEVSFSLYKNNSFAILSFIYIVKK